jgi:hypothetical protein
MTVDEEAFKDRFKKMPKDVRRFASDLLLELWNCYDWMEAKEDRMLIKNFFRDNCKKYRRLRLLVNDMKITRTMSSRIKKSVKNGRNITNRVSV